MADRNVLTRPCYAVFGQPNFTALHWVAAHGSAAMLNSLQSLFPTEWQECLAGPSQVSPATIAAQRVTKSEQEGSNRVGSSNSSLEDGKCILPDN